MQTKKVTVHLPVDLLKEAQEFTNMGVTETLIFGLEQVNRIKVYEELKKMKGKIKFSIDLDELRKDKDEE